MRGFSHENLISHLVVWYMNSLTKCWFFYSFRNLRQKDKNRKMIRFFFQFYQLRYQMYKKATAMKAVVILTSQQQFLLLIQVPPLILKTMIVIIMLRMKKKAPRLQRYQTLNSRHLSFHWMMRKRKHPRMKRHLKFFRKIQMPRWWRRAVKY